MASRKQHLRKEGFRLHQTQGLFVLSLRSKEICGKHLYILYLKCKMCVISEERLKDTVILFPSWPRAEPIPSDFSAQISRDTEKSIVASYKIFR
jgi:hypothetical protein